MPMTARFRRDDIDRMMQHLRQMGAPFGITFADRPFLSNSRPALMAAEFARDQGRFQPFHEALFSSYFSQGLDIGNIDVLMRVAADSGVDPEAMKNAVQGRTYLPTLQKAQEEATRLGVTGVPAFFINERRSIVGAQPLEVFRKALRSQ